MSTRVSATIGGLSAGSSSSSPARTRYSRRRPTSATGLGVGALGVAVLEPALVAAQLLLDPVGGLVEGGMGVGAAPAEPFSTTPCGTWATMSQVKL